MAADKRVRLVVGLDTFVGPDGNHAAEASAVDDPFHGGIERGVTQDETEGDPQAAVAGAPVDFLAADEGFRGGLFQKKVIAEIECPHGVVEVLGILGGDDQNIGQFAGGKDLVSGFEGRD